MEIAQRGYVGDCEEMTFCGSDPIKVTWEKRGDDFYVPIKAVDGFNLLSSSGFKDLLGVGVTGMKSLSVLMQSCLDLLELDLPFCNWIDLYAEKMDETRDVLSQTYVRLDRLFSVYEKPTAEVRAAAFSTLRPGPFWGYPQESQGRRSENPACRPL